MRRFLSPALWLIACCVCITPAVSFWQSRDSNYNVNVSGGGASFTGTGDVVSGFNAWWSPGIAYSAAYAAGLGNAADVCDSGGTNCITLKVQASGLVAAPGATACGGNACVSISKLYDQSGSNYCTGPCDLVQATNASRPLLLTNCGTGTMLCARFTTSGLVLNGPTLPTISQPFTISGVIEGSAVLGADTEVLSTPCQVLYGAGDDGGATNTIASLSAGLSFDNTTTVVAHNTMFSSIGVFNGSSSISAVNGTSTTGNTGTTNWQGGATALGFAGCFTGNKFNGHVEEIGIKAGAFTGPQITNVTSRQRTNWGF
jgi:hypothetical protein